MMAPLETRSQNKLIDSDFYVEGYATTFNDPYTLWEFEDGTKYYEQVDRNALKDADMSDVIFQYDHEGRVFARQSNGSLVIEPDDNGLRIGADLSRTDLAKSLYQDIKAGMITKMSWAFTVSEDSFDKDTSTRTIRKVKKVYDVSAVSLPANDDTTIAARDFARGRREAEQQEGLIKRVNILRIKAKI